MPRDSVYLVNRFCNWLIGQLVTCFITVVVDGHGSLGPVMPVTCSSAGGYRLSWNPLRLRRDGIYLILVPKQW